MSESSQSMPQRSVPGTNNWGSEVARRNLLLTLFYCSLAIAIGFMAYAAFRVTQDQDAMKKGQDRLVALRGLMQPTHKRLAGEFTDQDGGLLADPPGDRQRLLDPDTLVVAHYEGDEEDVPRVDWESFQAHLSQATGKNVVVQDYSNSAEDVEAIKAGKIHVVALHAADAPYVVNNAGFIPMAVLGTKSGASGNHLTIAVGATSPLKTLADIRGRKLTCTRPDSITGYRAAIVMLSQEAGMRPDVDYDIHFSHGQKRSIRGVVSGEFEVAALSDDKIRSMLKEGSLKPSEYRVIYKSQVIPRLAIGHVYNLEGELAAKVTSAAISFENEGGAADDSGTGPLRFVAVDYKKDFEFVRTMDDSFDPRFGKAHSGTSTP